MISHIRNILKLIRNDDGFSLGELMVMMPIYTVTLFSVVTVMTSGLRLYTMNVAEWELLDDIRNPALYIADDFRYCKSFYLYSNGIKMTMEDSPGNDVSHTYRWRSSDKSISCDGQPMTGKTILSSVEITKFKVTEVHDNNYQVRLEIVGKNKNSGKEYGIDTVLTSYNLYLKESDNDEKKYT